MLSISTMHTTLLAEIGFKYRYVVVLISLVLVGCSNYKEPQQADIPIFDNYITENLKSVSSDPFLSSTYRPGDKWYEILGYLQHGRHDLAVKLLEPLAEAEDPEAMFWLAKTRFRSSIENIGPAYDFYVKAANMGQPYAALALTPSNMYCERYFGNYCDEYWEDVALKSFTKLAKKGDVRAKYYLVQREPINNQQQRNAYLKQLIKFSEQGYYQPLYNYAMEIRSIEKPSKGLKQLSVNLLKVGANRNFIPAIAYLVSYREKITSESISEIDYLQKGVALGSTSSLGLKFFREDENVIKGDKELTALMNYELMGDDSYVNILFLDIKAKRGNEKFLVEKAIITKKLDARRQKAKDEIAKMNKMLYIDGFTNRSEWTQW